LQKQTSKMIVHQKTSLTQHQILLSPDSRVNDNSQNHLSTAMSSHLHHRLSLSAPTPLRQEACHVEHPSVMVQSQCQRN
jgi:RES domain-containing protein